MDQVFDDCIVLGNKNKVTVKARLLHTGLGKFGYWVLFLIPLAFVYYFPIDNIPYSVAIVIKVILMGILLFATHKLLIYVMSNTIITIDKEKKMLKSDLDNFTTNVGDIKEVSVIEEQPQESGAKDNLYRIKFILAEGEKTSSFAFSTYNKAKKVLDVIKDAISPVPPLATAVQN